METAMKSAVPSYDAKYSQGGWTYREPGERKHLELMLSLADLRPPAKIVEVACGMGFHTHLLHEMGFIVTGNDYSEVGIGKARDAYPGIEFVHGDSQKLPSVLGYGSFDAAMARGHSHHHYDLPLSGRSRKNVDVIASTKSMFDLVRSGGVLMMTIRTNFKGDDYKDGVVNNRMSAYRDLFSKFGKIEHITDLNGAALKNDEHAKSLGVGPDTGIIVITRKP
jgi:SAM-dependent methyltransferase